jgi:hypothetical protein
MRSSGEYGRGRSSTPLTTLNMAVLAPMPKAKVTTTTVVNAGFFAKERTLARRSWIIPATLHRRHLSIDERAVEQVHGTVRMTGVSRVMRHHANR